MAVQAVVFDLFHTLVNPDDFRPPGFDRLAGIAAVFAVEPEELHRYWWDEVVPVVVRSPRRPVEMLAEFAAGRGGRTGGPERAVAEDVLGRYQDMALLSPLPGAAATLAELQAHGVRTGLLSNAHERDMRMWNRSPLAPLLDALVISCFAGAAKPEPGSYGRVLADLGVSPGEAMFVGDGGSDEFAGARAAGFESVVCVAGPAVRTGFRTAAEMRELAAGADVRVDAVAEVGALAVTAAL